MEAIIAIVIIFWIVSTFAGAFGKQPGGKPRAPQGRQPGMPPFAPPGWSGRRERPVAPGDLGGGRMQADDSDGRSSGSGSVRDTIDPRRSDYGESTRSRDGGRGDIAPSDRRIYEAYDTVPDSKNAPVVRSDSGLHSATSAAGRHSGDSSMNSGTASPRNVTGQQPHTGAHPLLQQQHIVNGIIWSEILGPPKSRRRR